MSISISLTTPSDFLCSLRLTIHVCFMPLSLHLLTPPSPCLSLAPIPSASRLSAPSCLGMLQSLAGCWRFWTGTCRRPGSCYYYWELLLSKERSHISWIRRGCLASFCLIPTNSTYSLHTAPSYPQVQGRRHLESYLRTCKVTQGTEEGATSEFWWVERSALTHPHPQMSALSILCWKHLPGPSMAGFGPEAESFAKHSPEDLIPGRKLPGHRAGHRACRRASDLPSGFGCLLFC